LENRYRIVKKGAEARKSLEQGVNKVADLIASTMGPGGRNVIIQYRGNPFVTNDGATIAKNIILKDETEDLAAQAFIKTSLRTNDMVGDGTTACIVIAQRIIKSIFTKLKEEEHLVSPQSNLLNFYRQIQSDKKKVLEMLRKQAKQIKTKEDLEKVAITSLENEEWGKIVAGIAWQVGKDGYVGVDEHFTNKIETEVIDGMKFHGTYITELLANTPRKEAIIEDPLIVVTSHAIESQAQLKELADLMLKTYKTNELVLIANGYDKPSLAPEFCAVNRMKGVFNLLAVKAPSLDEDELGDVALYTGAKYFDKKKGIILTPPEKEDFGRAKKIVVDRDNVFIVSGRGNKKDIQKRIADLRKEQEAEPVENFRNKIKQRIASLSSGVGIIKVATNTNVETKYLKDKFDDAVCACKAALEEGVVKGGGLAFKEIADKMPKSILASALRSCYDQIQENAGGKLEIKADIIDPAKVLRIALENACSAAGIMITANGTIAEKRESIELEDLSKLLKAKDNARV